MSDSVRSMSPQVLNGRPPLSRRRCGFSLIETVGVIVLIGMLLSLCAATLHRAYRVHHAALDSFQELEQLNFWCERFRADVHQSLAMDLSAGPEQELILGRADGKSIFYSLAQGQLIRSVKQGDAQLAQEALAVVGPAEVHWTIDRNGRYPLISLHLNLISPDHAKQALTWTARLLNQQSAAEEATSLPTQ